MHQEEADLRHDVVAKNKGMEHKVEAAKDQARLADAVPVLEVMTVPVMGVGASKGDAVNMEARTLKSVNMDSTSETVLGKDKSRR